MRPSPTASILLEGEPEEIGRQHGRACADAIRAALEDAYARLAGEGGAWTRAGLRLEAAAIARHLAGVAPRLAAELDGIAAGAAIRAEEAVLLQYRRELAADASACAGECSLIAMRDAAGATIAQNVDLNVGMAGLGRVMAIRPASPKAPRSLVFSFAGMPAFVGLNAAGLAIGINFVLADGWRRAAISPYLLVRHLLGLRTIDECLAALRTLPRTSSRCFTIADCERIASIEMTVDALRVCEGDRLLHTNHYLDPELQPLDRMHIFSRNASRRRLDILAQRTAEANARTEPEALFEMLADHSMYPLGLCVHAEGVPERDATVAAIVMRPAAGELHVRHGNPCEQRTVIYHLDGSCAATSANGPMKVAKAG